MLQTAQNYEPLDEEGPLFDTPHDYVVVFLERLADCSETEVLRNLNLDLSGHRDDCARLLYVASRHFKLKHEIALPEGRFTGNDLIKLIELELETSYPAEPPTLKQSA